MSAFPLLYPFKCYHELTVRRSHLYVPTSKSHFSISQGRLDLPYRRMKMVPLRPRPHSTLLLFPIFLFVRPAEEYLIKRCRGNFIRTIHFLSPSVRPSFLLDLLTRRDGAEQSADGPSKGRKEASERERGNGSLLLLRRPTDFVARSLEKRRRTARPTGG